MAKREQEHAVYRLHGAGGRLLYVGMSIDPWRRLMQHKSSKPWWEDIATLSIEKQPTRDEALAAERAAIKAEKPLYNVMHNEVVLQPAFPFDRVIEETVVVQIIKHMGGGDEEIEMGVGALRAALEDGVEEFNAALARGEAPESEAVESSIDAADMATAWFLHQIQQSTKARLGEG